MNLYHKLLNLPEAESAYDHYELLGIPQFTDDAQQIHAAAVTRNTQLRGWQNSDYHREADLLMNEVATASIILEDPQKKAEYDHKLRSKLGVVVTALVPARPSTTAEQDSPTSRASAPSPKAKPADKAEVNVLGWLETSEPPTDGGRRTAPSDPLQTKQISLSNIVIRPSVLKLIPASVAREDGVLPLALVNDRLRVAMSNTADLDLIDKLRFILNCEIEPVEAPQEAIQKAVNHHYGVLVANDDGKGILAGLAAASAKSDSASSSLEQRLKLATPNLLTAIRWMQLHATSIQGLMTSVLFTTALVVTWIYSDSIFVSAGFESESNYIESLRDEQRANRINRSSLHRSVPTFDKSMTGKLSNRDLSDTWVKVWGTRIFRWFAVFLFWGMLAVFVGGYRQISSQLRQ